MDDKKNRSKRKLESIQINTPLIGYIRVHFKLELLNIVKFRSLQSEWFALEWTGLNNIQQFKCEIKYWILDE